MEAGITKDIVAAAVAKANLEFRPGHGELLRWMDRERVPLLMFSAGIAGELRVISAEASIALVCGL